MAGTLPKTGVVVSMTNRDKTTIEIERANWRRLNARKEEPGESFNDVIDRILQSDA